MSLKMIALAVAAWFVGSRVSDAIPGPMDILGSAS